MARKISRLAFATFLATAVAGYGVAFANDDDDDDDSLLTGDDDDDDGGGITEPTPDDSVSSDGGGGGDFYKMGIATAFPTGGSAVTADLLWGLDADTYLNINLGISFNKGAGEIIDPMMPPESETTFGTAIGVGYRMYRDRAGRIRPYLEPGVLVAIDDFSAFGDTLTLAADAILGVDMDVVEQFSLGIGVGGGILFANSFDTISFELFTTSIEATFWW